MVWLYRRLVKMLEQCGPVRVVPGKTGITFQARMRFAGARLGKSSVRVGFVLTVALWLKGPPVGCLAPAICRPAR